MEDFSILPVLVENRIGYKNLCELLTQAHLRSEKGKCEIKWDELPQFAEGLVALFNASLLAGGTPAATEERAIENTASPTRTRPYLIDLINVFRQENVFVEIQRH